jgi:hypothetical protein
MASRTLSSIVRRAKQLFVFMKSKPIELLLHSVRDVYGPSSVRPCADSDDDQFGTSFTVIGIEATFSVLTREGTLPDGHYDIQIESYPPGDYIYTDVVSLRTFMELLRSIAGPTKDWPTQT